MSGFFIKGLLIGLIFGVPAGAIGALTIRRTLKGGFAAGLATGIGSSAADVLYACVGAFGITVISDFIENRQGMIGLVGGILIILMGLSVWRKKETSEIQEEKKTHLHLYFFSSFAVAITNPATVLSFLAAFAVFEIRGKIGAADGAGLILGILLGTLCWWGGLSGIVTLLRSKITDRIYGWLNRILGCLLIVLGVAAIIRAIV